MEAPNGSVDTGSLKGTTESPTRKTDDHFQYLTSFNQEVQNLYGRRECLFDAEDRELAKLRHKKCTGPGQTSGQFKPLQTDTRRQSRADITYVCT